MNLIKRILKFLTAREKRFYFLLVVLTITGIVPTMPVIVSYN